MGTEELSLTSKFLFSLYNNIVNESKIKVFFTLNRITSSFTAVFGPGPWSSLAVWWHTIGLFFINTWSRGWPDSYSPGWLPLPLHTLGRYMQQRFYLDTCMIMRVKREIGAGIQIKLWSICMDNCMDTKFLQNSQRVGPPWLFSGLGHDRTGHLSSFLFWLGAWSPKLESSLSHCVRKRLRWHRSSRFKTWPAICDPAHCSVWLLASRRFTTTQLLQCEPLFCKRLAKNAILSIYTGRHCLCDYPLPCQNVSSTARTVYIHIMCDIIIRNVCPDVESTLNLSHVCNRNYT